MPLTLYFCSTFQHKLIKCQEEPLLLGDTFVEAQDSLQMYVSYCQSKSRALEAYREFLSFFEVEGGMGNKHLCERGSFMCYVCVSGCICVRVMHAIMWASVTR